MEDKELSHQEKGWWFITHDHFDIVENYYFNGKNIQDNNEDKNTHQRSIKE